MRISKYRNFIRACGFLLALSMNGVTAHAADDDEIIEFQGDRYVIHVDRMNPDSDDLDGCVEHLSRILVHQRKEDRPEL